MWKDYQATLWDFDGIIVDTEWPIYESWLTIFRRNFPERLTFSASAVTLRPGHLKYI